MASMHFLLNVQLFLFLLCKVTSMEQVYLVKLTIGGIESHLVLDTEIPFTWVSWCSRLSSTAHELLFTHPLCRKPDCNRHPGKDLRANKGRRSDKCNCKYRSHKNMQVTRGVLSDDIFEFTPTAGNYVTEKKNIAFVYGSSTNPRLPSKAIGILGMGFGPTSVPSQYSKSFSYCLPLSYEETAFLRFDVDKPRTSRPVFSTPIVRVPGKSMYYLKLTGISVAGERLKIPPKTFDATPYGGGCFVDTGSPFTELVTPAYNVVKEAFAQYFEKHEIVETPAINYSKVLDMCYFLKDKNRNKLDQLQTLMVLHFEGADFVIGPSELFVMYDDVGVFCVALLSSDYSYRIGNYQQRNKMFVFDLERDMLHVYPQDCSNLHLQAI